jgi:hypothetical protein
MKYWDDNELGALHIYKTTGKLRFLLGCFPRKSDVVYQNSVSQTQLLHKSDMFFQNIQM